MANCRIRIYVTCDSQGNPITSELGHYDIQFDGSYTIDGRSYTNPVISYGGGDGNPGKITIFNAAKTSTVFAGKKFQAYSFSFTATSSAVQSCINSILSYLNTNNETQITSNAYRYNVTSGRYATYHLSSTNCFSATATFANWLGYSTLLGIYNAANGNYASYSAYNMWLAYGNYWTYHGFYNC